MDRPLRILLLEDSTADAELVERELRRRGLSFVVRRVDTREAFVGELDGFGPDLILADWSLPTFDGLTALSLVRRRAREVPYIFVSGSIGEERAVEALKQGATDYILKGQLIRLVPAVLRAMAEVEAREERRGLEAQLRQALKMEAIGQLAGGVAHDFNNLLTVISGYASLVLTKLPEDHPSRPHVLEIQNAGERAAALTRQLLAFSRKQASNPRVLDLNQVVANVEKLLRRVIGEDVELAISPGAGLGQVKIDPGQIEQVLMNLAVNARDAMPEGGRLSLQTSNVEFDETYARNHLGIRPGPYVMLVVGDTGCGMSEETLQHLFEPFFTTKGPDKGTGLGLATVYGIVKQAEGSVEVRSEPGRGSTFRILLPRVGESADPAARPAERSAPKGSETVLVVEDEEAVRLLVCEVLRTNSYSVLETGGAHEALRACEDHGGKISLVVSDVVMPEMNGMELADRLEKIRPGMRNLFLSGYTSEAILGRGIASKGVPFLQKPFSPVDLLHKVREVLDGPGKA